MRKEEFLERLEMLLSDISEEEREEAMAFYRSYFEDAGIGNEARIIEELESPENVAETIKRDLGMVTVTTQESEFYEEKQEHHNDDYAKDQQESDTYYRWTENQNNNQYGNYTDSQTSQQEGEKKSWLVPLLIVIAVFTFPTWFGLLAGIVGTVFGLSVALIAVTFAMFVLGVVFVGLGIAMLAGLGSAIVSIPVGLAFVGSGLLILALALLLLLACVAVFGTFMPWASKGIINLCKKPFAKKEAQTV